MKRPAKIFAATLAALALTASLALAAEAVNTPPDTNQASPGQQHMGAESGHMGQNGSGHMSAAGYAHMGQNSASHMSADGQGRMARNGNGHMDASSHMGPQVRPF